MDKIHSQLFIERKGDILNCELIGDWTTKGSAKDSYKAWNDFWGTQDAAKIRSCTFKLRDDSSWDSSLVVFLLQAKKSLVKNDILFDDASLPKKVANLLNFRSMQSLNLRRENHIDTSGKFLFFKVLCSRLFPFFTFWGKWLMSLTRLPVGKSHMRAGDLLKACRDCGALGLPIITLISFLTGLTMAFVGSVQLQKFNAMIYIADLVSLAMVREMGALMVAIVMAGRTGASFAAELGSMKLNEEIDSLRTFGVSVMDFLVLPRVLGILIMTPLLTLYADVIGIVGGLTVGVYIMDFSASHYMEQTQAALDDMWEIYSGLFKSVVFGLVVGLVGCYKGLNAGSNSSDLGKAVTSSVVLSITLIVICDASFEAVFSYFGLR